MRCSFSYNSLRPNRSDPYKSKLDHITPLLKTLRWMPTSLKTKYILLSLAYRPCTICPSHWLSLGPSSSVILPFTTLLIHGLSFCFVNTLSTPPAFTHAVPSAWNPLLSALQEAGFFSFSVLENPS